MNQFNFSKLFASLAFVAFMFISCWATVESLHLLDFGLPKFMLWIATLGTFFLASYGSSMIVDSFDGAKDVSHRGLRLIGGIVVLVVFWILFSLPTNTHTFYYNKVVTDVLNKDLTETKIRLDNMLTDNTATNIVNKETEAYKSNALGLLSQLKQELTNPEKLGWGPEAQKVALKLESMLGGTQEIQRIGAKSNTYQGWKDVSDQIDVDLRKRINETANIKRELRLSYIRGLKKEKDIKKDVDYITKLQEKLKIDPVAKKHEPSSQTKQILDNAHVIINEYYTKIIDEFKDNNAKDTAGLLKSKGVMESVMSNSNKLSNVFEVWMDYFNSKLNGEGFIYWILLAALVDIAGFLFFNLAKK